MGTRSGDIDAAILEYLMQKENMTITQMEEYLNKKSGVLGISGVSSDFRDLSEAEGKGNDRARIALDVFAYRVKKYIGSYMAAMGGVDCIVFTAGIGENDIGMRERILSGMDDLGIKLDKSRNDVRGKERLISTDDSAIKVYVIPTDEEMEIAGDTMKLIQ